MTVVLVCANKKKFMDDLVPQVVLIALRFS